MPDDFVITANELKVEINKAVDSLGEAAPIALDWTTGVDLDSEAATFEADVIAIGTSVFDFTEGFVQASGDLTLNAFGFVKLNAAVIVVVPVRT